MYFYHKLKIISKAKSSSQNFLINLQAPHSNLNFLQPVNQQQWWWGQLGGRSCCARKVAPLKFPSFSFFSSCSHSRHSHIKILVPSHSILLNLVTHLTTLSSINLFMSCLGWIGRQVLRQKSFSLRSLATLQEATVVLPLTLLLSIYPYL